MWRLLALRGVVAIAFAIVLLVWPDIGLSAMVAVVGASRCRRSKVRPTLGERR